MKKKSLKFSMLILLSLATSTLFAQTMKVSEAEMKLTDNGKQWMWYKSSGPNDVNKNETYAFDLKTHTVDLSLGGSAKKQTFTWKVAVAKVTPAGSQDSKTAPVDAMTILIGTKTYVLTFGSDDKHTENLGLAILKAGVPAAVTDYYYSVSMRKESGTK